jgi:RNA polymerase sigma-32 factor
MFDLTSADQTHYDTQAPSHYESQAVKKSYSKALVQSAQKDLDITSQAAKMEYLSRETERELVKNWSQNGCMESRERLINAHYRMVANIARERKTKSLSLNDLIQEGCLGLMKAVEKFEMEYDNLFSTYAKWWVNAQIQDYVLKQGALVRAKSSSPNRTIFFGAARALSDAELKLRQDGGIGYVPSQTEIENKAAELMKITPKRFGEVANTCYQAFSLHAPAGQPHDDEGMDFIDLLEDEGGTGEDILISNNGQDMAMKYLADVLGVLTDREREIVVARHMSDVKITLESLAGNYGISRERVRQIDASALKKMKGVLQKQGVQDIFDMFG